MIFDRHLKYKHNYNNSMILILYIAKKKRNTKVDPKVMSHYSPNFNIHKIDNFFLYVFVLAQVPWILCAPLY